MSTNVPQRCPFCDSPDVRRVSMPDVDLTGFYCRECSKVFYVGSLVRKHADRAAAANAPQTSRRQARAKRTP